MPSIQLSGIPGDWLEFAPMVEELQRALFDEIGWPKLKSDFIMVTNEPHKEVPMYLSGVPFELIRVAVAKNWPWKFAYQLAHELGHLSARSDLRHPRIDGLMWIEEALCECHSLIGMAHLAKAGPRPEHAQSYLDNLLSTNTPPDSLGGAHWFEAHAAALAAARTLTEEAKVMARHIFRAVEPARILYDNRHLIDLPTGLPLDAFLVEWQSRVGDGLSVPHAIRKFVAAAPPVA